jgi:hypothetical protein
MGLMVRMQVQLTAEQLSGLRAVAEREGISQAEVVRQALDAYLPRHATDPSAARERLRSVIGAFHSGESDVSVRHDDYLVEAIMASHGMTDTVDGTDSE